MILHSRIIGEGKPFVILHGLLGMGDNWKTLGRKFTDLGYQVHLVDQRNHGRSFRDDAFNYKLMAADVLEYCDYHQLEEIILLGHSMGGKAAMKFATAYPEKVEKLIVADIGPKAYPQHHQDILKALSLLNFSEMSSRTQAEVALSEYIKEVGVRLFLLKNLYWKEKGLLSLRVNLPVIIDKIEAVGEALPKDAKFEKETLFLGGANSGYIEPHDAMLIRHHFPNSEIDMVSNAGHWLHAENPAEFYDKVVKFL